MNNSIDKLTADIIIENQEGAIVLIRRKNEPFKGMWALPGGKLEGNETIEQTAIREAKEETGLDIRIIQLVGVYSKPNRDPRGRYVSIVYSACSVGGKLRASSDAKEIMETKEFGKVELAFDHNKIIEDYLKTKLCPNRY